MRKPFFILLSLLCTTAVFSQKNPLFVKEISDQQQWVDSVFRTLDTNEKIGQLFMVDVFSSDPKSKTNAVLNLIKKHKIGGVIFSKGGPVQQARLNNTFQENSEVPLLIGMDAEWGLGMRLDSVQRFPYNMALGAIKDNDVVEAVGREIGLQCKRLGVHINFAPVVDININPKNPIIGNRSFGEDRDNVTQKAIALLKGMQSVGVLGNAKHFPGHGDTDQDSHKTLPTLPFSRKRLDSIEMYPYKKIIDAGVASVMIAHLNVPTLESKPGYPTSLSEYVVQDLLMDSLDFGGLIFTDALNMKGASNFKQPGDIDLAAFKAGNDILLISENVPKAIEKIKNAFDTGEITKERLDRSVRKILFAKYKAGATVYKPVSTENLIEDLNGKKAEAVARRATAASLTVLRNQNAVLPVKDLLYKKVAYVPVGDDDGQAFFDQMQKYTQVDRIKKETLAETLQALQDYNYVIIGFHRSDANPWTSYTFSSEEINWIKAIAKKKETVLDLFVRPYALLDFEDNDDIAGIVLSYQNSVISQQISAQMIFGAYGAEGRVPVSLGEKFPLHTSYETGTLRRLKYGVPEEVGIDSDKLEKVDSLVRLGMKKVMFPGAQLLIAKDGKVIYEKAFGHHTYTDEIPVDLNDVYDLASMTKILATLPLMMELYDKKAYDLDDGLGRLIPQLRESNKEQISVKQALSHYGRLKPWIPFYFRTLDSTTGKIADKYYRKVREADYDIEVATELYLRSDYPDSIIKQIADSDLLDKQEYRYSDLSYYLLKEYLEKTYRKNLDVLTQSHFYKWMGAYRTGYLPLKKFEHNDIVPSENDTYWRIQKVQGYVHDMGAAMQGNIGGHAGLFSNANDVAKIMQMYLQNGYYGGKRYFSRQTMKAFNTRYYLDDEVRRGVGFDKPQLDEVGPTCGCVSEESFGHSGFTGTLAWADPETNLIYVFLSNRTFPTADNRKLITSNLRTEIQQVIQDALFNNATVN
ncbi:MAG: glycoside hydrolase family 3 N-terminal domain-containing protein [Leeuwenhoekiella sp.]